MTYGAMEWNQKRPTRSRKLTHMMSYEDAEKYAAYRVREALEEAIKIVEQEANDGANFRNFVIDPHWIVHRIRALMPEAK